MTYRVYEDDPADAARVHAATCSRCNNGVWMSGSRLPDNRWHGPFGTKLGAIDQALQTRRRDNKGCWFFL